VTATEREQLIDRLEGAYADLCMGPLGEFPLFWEISNLLFPCGKVDPLAEQKLATKLGKMVTAEDWEGLFKVARSVKHWSGKPESPLGKDRINPDIFDETLEVLLFFRKHVDEDWTLAEIHEHLESETNVRVEFRKKLKRWCERYKFPVKE
jgi:hypothetical protein